jgi:hypothetical protein
MLPSTDMCGEKTPNGLLSLSSSKLPYSFAQSWAFSIDWKFLLFHAKAALRQLDFQWRRRRVGAANTLGMFGYATPEITTLL